MSICGASLFGNQSQFIKINNGDFVAVQGSDIRERLITSDLRMPYKQILKSRIILKPGQVNYLLNHLGLGDNATFLGLRATYDPKSVIADDNYINWSYYDDLGKVNYFAQMMVLTGNNIKRIPQLYLTNPNTKYPVFIDVMVGSIDDTYSPFTDTINQSGTSFTGLEYTDIKTFVIGESVVIYDKNTPKRALIYFGLPYVNSIELNNNILIVDDQSLGTVFLSFLTNYDARQAHSLLNYVLENPNVNIDSLVPSSDDEPPVIQFNSTAGATGSYITLGGATSGVPYSTEDGFTFSTTISLSNWGTASVLYKDKLQDLLIDYIVDNRDGTMSIMDSEFIISGTSGEVTSIASVGSYSVTFRLDDLATNGLDGVIINLDITT